MPNAVPRSGAQSANLLRMPIARLDAISGLTATGRKWHADDLPHPEDPVLDVSDWQNFKLPQRPNSAQGLGEAVVGWEPVWFRPRIVIPKAMGGDRIVGLPVKLNLKVLGGGNAATCCRPIRF